ncbi:ABC transporter substrate-binding protein [Calothrix sp. PCC 6303]|uniref:ABC transporter substrate-binding protein n=1 Tax=Calothrix sp. PCC 6303 TaxID=1170562 RepID=UPI0002A014B5|nr:ABC transporter substrate-binding protein [Calothrix sp. PCC 6303]AFZ04033.1 extracellular solute-binding protein family 5 [Calothrix sp. PCC 6303]
MNSINFNFSRKKIRLVGILTCLGLWITLLLNGCNLSNFRTVAAQAPSMIVAVLGEPSTFNSALNESAYSVFGFIYDSLINTNPLTAKLEPALAESWQITDNGQRILINLRPNLKWSDGQPMTADDIIFTYNDIYLNPKIPAPIKDALKIGESGKLPSVKKISDLQVEFSVPEPFAPFINLVGGITILPKHSLKAAIDKKDSQGNSEFISTWTTGTDPKKIVGNGPYVMESYVPSQRVIFKRNPYYWRKDAQGKPQPYIERIVYQIIESTDNQLVSFRSGGLDSLEVSPEGFSLLKREEKRAKFTIYDGGPDTGTTFITFNQSKAKNPKGQPLVDPIKSKWFNQKEFRQAIAYAIDRGTIKTNAFRGLGVFQNSFVYERSPFYLTPEKGLKVYDYNPQKSKEILTKAGFKYNSQNQLLDAEGNPVKFTILTNSERKVRTDMVNQITKDLAKIGIEADKQILSFNAYLGKLKDTEDWDAYIGGFAGGGFDPHGASNIWRINGASHAFNLGQQPGKPKKVGWEASDWEKEIDKLYVKAAQEIDENKRKELYYEYQRIASEQLPFIHLVERLDLQAVRDRFQGIKYTALGGAFWNIHELKID